MLFIDGENLALRYKAVLGSDTPQPHIQYCPDVFVWSEYFDGLCIQSRVLRKHYYTSATGDADGIVALEDRLRAAGIEAPYVFKRTKGRGSKRVDIQLTTDMLLHGARKNYETAVLVAGDEDYVPLVQAVKSEGITVVVWFIDDGLSPALKRAADHFSDIGEILFATKRNHWQ